MTQCSRLIRALPACTAVLLLAGVAPLHAQQRVRLPQGAGARTDSDANSAVVTTVAPGTELTLGTTKGALVQATFEGYIWAGSVKHQGRTTHLTVSAANGENLRVEPNVKVVARLPTGFPLEQIARQGGWINVRASAWFDATGLAATAPAPVGGRLGAVAAAASQRKAPAPVARQDTTPVAAAPATPADTSGVNLDRALAARAAPLHRVPDGATIGTVAVDAPLKILARSGDWVRVQTEGWVLASDVRPGGGVMVGVSGAEIRARPQDFEGKLLQWNVQFISIQTADELRRDIRAGRRYVLARGPMPESGFLYLLASDAQIKDLTQFSPLAEIVIVGRVRLARSTYLGNPILDLVDVRAVHP